MKPKKAAKRTNKANKAHRARRVTARFAPVIAGSFLPLFGRKDLIYEDKDDKSVVHGGWRHTWGEACVADHADGLYYKKHEEKTEDVQDCPSGHKIVKVTFKNL